MTGPTAVVTGAGGFIGSHLCELLVERGYRTRAFVHYDSRGGWGWLDESPVKDELDVVAGDVRDFETVRRAVDGADTVFHLAALIGIPYSYAAPTSYVDTNVHGTLNVLRAAVEASARVVHTSTSEVYGTAQRVPIDESHPIAAQSPYAASKIAADMLAESYHRSFELPVVTVRPFNAFGPRQSSRAVIPTIAVQALTGGPIQLGNITPTRDFTFVADTAEAFVLAAEAPQAVGRVLNVGTGSEVSIAALASLIAELTGTEADVVEVSERSRPPASEVERLCADSTLARELLGWAPRRTLADGLRETISWLEPRLDRYRPSHYAV